MAIFSAQSLFSENQAITADVASTNIIDLGATGTVLGAPVPTVRDIGKGRPIEILAQVVEAFNNLTSLGIQVQMDDNDGFASPTTLTTETLLLADLVVGAKKPILVLPTGIVQRYLRLFYDFTGAAPTTGRVTAGIVMGVQTNP